MSKKEFKGVRGVLGGLTSGDDALKPISLDIPAEPTERAPEPVDEPREALPEPAVVAQPKPAAPEKSRKEAAPKLKARIGRPPGVKTGNSEPKTKASLWINAALMERYRSRSWQEQCQIGELIERALADYEKRRWGPPKPSAGNPAIQAME